MKEATSVLNQESNNDKTHLVYMSVEQVEGYVASHQTGKFPRTSYRYMKYICIFYIHDHNFIKGISLKSRKKQRVIEGIQGNLHIL